MKLSVSLTDRDVEIIDHYVRKFGLPSRSAAIQQAVRRLQGSEMTAAYEAAWQEWADSDEELSWSAVIDDGLADAPR